MADAVAAVAGGGPGGGDDEEEGILVAIRMRPLSARESSRGARTVWRVLRKHASVAQTLPTGCPLPERTQGRNFFTYDRTYGERSSTREVYDGTVRNIVGSVCSPGLNGTVFAYGQTSSGKTHTMQGSGSIEDGSSSSSNDTGGIVHMAANDIFDNIKVESDRVFLVRVSFIEIYNEEVRDLLAPPPSSGEGSTAGAGRVAAGPVLAVREDPHRGVFVDSNETIVASASDLLGVLFEGERNRSVASTEMNERSSRSHTIFRITVESRPGGKEEEEDGMEKGRRRKKKRRKEDGDDAGGEEDDDDDDDVDGDDDDGDGDGDDGKREGPVRVSTLNLVDLAGSESVRHTGATGDRQKEGGKINRSLLTLSRVIGSLGENNSGNSGGGGASQPQRHVNFRDSKLTRILQPSLEGNARMAVICCATPSEMYLEETRSTLQFASRAKLVKTRAQVNEIVDDRSLIKKLQRELREARRGGPGREATERMRALEEKAATAEHANRKAKEDVRRMKRLILVGGGVADVVKRGGALSAHDGNDGTIDPGEGASTLGGAPPGGGRTRRRRYSDGVAGDASEGSGGGSGDCAPQGGLFSSPTARHRNATAAAAATATTMRAQSRTEVKPRRKKTHPPPSLHCGVSANILDVDLLREALAAKSSQAADLRARLGESEKKAKVAAEGLEFERMNRRELEDRVSSLASDKDFVLSEQDLVMEEKDAEIASSLGRIKRMLEEREEQATAAVELRYMTESLRGQVAAKEAECRDQVEALNRFLEEKEEERRDKAEALNRVLAEKDAEVRRHREESAVRLAQVECKLSERVASLKGSNEELSKMLAEKEVALVETQAAISALKEESLAATSRLTKEMIDLCNAKKIADGQAAAMESERDVKLTELEGKLEEATIRVESLQTSNDDAGNLLMEKDRALDEAMSTINALKENASRTTEHLAGEKGALEEHVAALEARLDGERLASQAMVRQLETAKDEVVKLAEKNSALQSNLADAKTEKEEHDEEMMIRVASWQNANDDAAKLLMEKEAALEAAHINVTHLEAEASQVKSQLSHEVSELRTTLEAEQAVAATKLAEVEGNLASLKGDNEVIKSLLVEKEAALENAEGSIVTLKEESSSNVSELLDAKAAAEERAATLECELESVKEAATVKLADLEIKLQAATEQTTCLQNVENEVLTVSSERDVFAKKVESLQVEVADYTSKMEGLQSNIIGFDALRHTLEEQSKELVSAMEGNEEALAAAQREKDDVMLQLRAAESERDECLSEAEMAITEKEHMLFELNAMEAQHAETIKKFTEEIDSLKGQVSDAMLQKIELTNDMAAVYAEKEDLAAKVESTLSELAAVRDDAETKISRLQSSTESLVAERDAVNVQVSEVLSKNKDAEAVLFSLRSERAELALSLEASKADIARIEQEKEEGVSKLIGLEDSVADSQSQIESLTADLSAAQSENSKLKSQIEDAAELEQKQCMEKLLRVTEEKEMLASELFNKITLIEQKSEEAFASSEAIALFNTQRSQFTVQISALTQERDGLKKRVEEATSKCTTLTLERDNAEAMKAKSDEEKGALIEKVDEYIAQLESERVEAQAKLARAESELNRIVSQAKATEANYKVLESEKEEVEAENKRIVASLHEEICRLSDQLTSLNNQASGAVNYGGDSDTINALNKEVLELKSLLSSANDSVEEARSAALLADRDLDEKEMQLDDALRDLSEHQEARRTAEDKLRLAESSHRNFPARTDPEEELLREMEVLMGEKIDAESRLEEERNRRRDVEEKIKKAAEEEKQLLMDEAEDKMISLRDEISQLKSDISRVESGFYSVNEKNAELQDKIKRAEDRAADAESIVTLMRDEVVREQNEKRELQMRMDGIEEESTAFKSQVFAAKASFEAEAQAQLARVEEQLHDVLSQLAKWKKEAELSRETVVALNNDIEEYQKEVDSIKGMADNEKEITLSKLREELAQTKLDLSHAEAECLAAKRERETAKEKVDRIKRHEHEKQQKFAAKAKEAIETLKDRLAKAEAAQTDSCANNVLRTEIENLQMEVKELKITHREKDERIKKLEKSKITKAQIQNIQRLKDERSQFMTEAKEYKQRVEELEKHRPRRSGLRERKDSSHDQSKEIEKLQDDLRQCNNKLRKYVQHCERLENDRKCVMEAISSSDVGDIVGNSMSELVASLCDKLVSVEEECDTLNEVEQKAAEYLAQLDSLRSKYSALESQAHTYEQKDTKLNSDLAECKSSLQKARDKIATLNKDKEALQAMSMNAKENMSGLQSEQRRQMQYLESENLQLGDELKKTKKELSTTKADLETIQKNAFCGEQTEELHGLSTLLGSASRMSVPMESASKHASMMPGSKHIPLCSSRKRCPESPINEESSTEKENLLNKKHRTVASPFSSAKKKRSANPFSSVKKAARRTRKALTDDTPTKHYALGDSEPTADITNECQQS